MVVRDVRACFAGPKKRAFFAALSVFGVAVTVCSRTAPGSQDAGLADLPPQVHGGMSTKASQTASSFGVNLRRVW